MWSHCYCFALFGLIRTPLPFLRILTHKPAICTRTFVTSKPLRDNLINVECGRIRTPTSERARSHIQGFTPL